MSSDGANGGRSVSFDAKDYAHVDHGYAATIHKAQGMTVDRAHMLATPGMFRHRDGLAATVRDQHRHLRWMAIGGLLIGMLLWSFLPGFIARSMSTSWHWP